jgi:DSF synthase
MGKLSKIGEPGLANPLSPLASHAAQQGSSPRNFGAHERDFKSSDPKARAAENPRANPIASFSAAVRELDIDLDQPNETLWCYLKTADSPSFTPPLLRELIELRQVIQQCFLQRRPDEPAPFKYFVGGSRIPGIYNMGGDFQLLLRSIRAGDRAGLLRYAQDCVDVAFHMWSGFGNPVVTIALVQGDALGGGFEGALSFNVFAAERGTKFGLPEVLFRLFPGMGAFSFLSRKLDAIRADRMIKSGTIYSAEELHELGLVDILADAGHGEDAVRRYISENKREHGVHEAMYRARRRVNPLTLEELIDITRIWVDVALNLSDADLRKMERLMQAQARRLAVASKIPSRA